MITKNSYKYTPPPSQEDIDKINIIHFQWIAKQDLNKLFSLGAITKEELISITNMIFSPDTENLVVAQELIKIKIIEESLNHGNNKWLTIEWEKINK